MTAKPSLPSISSWEITLLKLLLLLSCVCFAIGIYLPIMTVTKLFFIESRFSIIGGLTDLYLQERYVLLVLISSLSLLLPAFKLCLLARVLFMIKDMTVNVRRSVEFIHNIGRWAMLDVLVVAVLLVSVKLGALASVQIHSGLYWFAGCVLLTMWISHRCQTLIKR